MKREKYSEPEQEIFDTIAVKKEKTDVEILADSPLSTSPPNTPTLTVGTPNTPSVDIPAKESSSGKTSNWFGISASYDVVKERPTGRVQIQWVSSYDGEALNGIRHGSGVYIDAKHRIKYEGQFFHGKRHGKGKITTPEYTYEGDFANDVIHGSGVVTNKDGKCSGNWFYGKIHGTYTSERVDGIKITCEYVSGVRHGTYTITYPNGRVVCGTWNHGKLVN